MCLSLKETVSRLKYSLFLVTDLLRLILLAFQRLQGFRITSELGSPRHSHCLQIAQPELSLLHPHEAPGSTSAGAGLGNGLD